MTLKTFQERINRYVASHPFALDDEVVIDENWLTVAAYIVDENFNAQNGLERGRAHWDLGPGIMRLPQDVTKEVING